MPSIAVIDYGMGNVKSVVNAFRKIGADVALVADPTHLDTADAVVLLGVGAFGEGIGRLRTLGFEYALREQVLTRGKPFLGICLGLQLLATTGLEHGEHKGLDWISGVSMKIPTLHQVRLPHVGWNTIRIKANSSLFDGLSGCEAFYFLHSYVLVPSDVSLVTSVTSYGSDLVASVQSKNIFGTQFHPEKSHTAGLRLLTNFANVSRA